MYADWSSSNGNLLKLRDIAMGSSSIYEQVMVFIRGERHETTSWVLHLEAIFQKKVLRML